MSTEDYSANGIEHRVRALEIRLAENHVKLEERNDILKLTASNLEHRLYLLNELRGDVLTKTSFDILHEALVRRIDGIEKAQAKILTTALVLVTIIGLVATVARFIKP